MFLHDIVVSAWPQNDTAIGQDLAWNLDRIMAWRYFTDCKALGERSLSGHVDGKQQRGTGFSEAFKESCIWNAG